MRVMSEDLTFLEVKTGSSSKGNWFLLLVEDSKSKHFSYFVKSSDDYKKFKRGDPIVLELDIRKNKNQNGSYEYIIRVV